MNSFPAQKPSPLSISQHKLKMLMPTSTRVPHMICLFKVIYVGSMREGVILDDLLLNRHHHIVSPTSRLRRVPTSTIQGGIVVNRVKLGICIWMYQSLGRDG